MNELVQNEEDPWFLFQKVVITAGPFEGMEGVITLINRKEGLVRVSIDFFGRPTPVELSYSFIKPVAKT